jgi:hypothetical protein
MRRGLPLAGRRNRGKTDECQSEQALAISHNVSSFWRSLRRAGVSDGPPRFPCLGSSAETVSLVRTTCVRIVRSAPTRRSSKASASRASLFTSRFYTGSVTASAFDANSILRAVSKYLPGPDDHRQTASSISSPFDWRWNNRLPMCPRVCVQSEQRGARPDCPPPG